MLEKKMLEQQNMTKEAKLKAIKKLEAEIRETVKKLSEPKLAPSRNLMKYT